MTLQKMSESVYLGMCHKIGTPKQVAFRRDIVDMTELFNNRNYLVIPTLSGSRREGFRLPDSDIDAMFSLNNLRVIWDFS